VVLVSRAAALCGLLLLLLASPAAAGPPGTWTALNDAESNTLEVGVARGGNGVLNVLWTRDQTVFNTQISANAANVTGPHTVFLYEGEGGGATTGVSLLPAPGGGLRAFFAGLADGDPHDVGMSTATSADGASWTVQPTLASASQPGKRSPVYAAQGIGGTIANNGVPISIWGDSSPGSAGYHVGTDDKDEDVHFGGSGATVGSPNAATDTVTGQIVIAWGDIDSGRTITQSIFPAGPQVSPPGGEAADLLERVAMTGRDGPGIFVAYLRGTNPFSGRPAVWRVGASEPMVLSNTRGAQYPGVARSTDGRLWAFWGRESRIYAARSNTKATRFGATVKIKPPKGTDTLYSLEGEGTAPGGALDILALAQGPNVDIDNFHQRIRPGIALTAKALGNGQVRFKTRDAGAKLDATITFAGKTKQTGDDGKVVISAEPGKHTAKATRDGYHPAKRRVKVN
jgi:hypothetical protein